MSGHSIKERFAISMASNIVRGLLTLLTTIVLARLLGTDDYGRVAFLLATFQAIRQLLDPGVSSAFYTFLSQRTRPRRFIFSYGFFLAAKYILIACVVGFIMPDHWINYAWHGESRDLIIFALSAVLMQYEWWPSAMQIFESQRRTALAQGQYLFLLLLQLTGVLTLSIFDLLTIKSFMLTSATLWATGTFFSILRYHAISNVEPDNQTELVLKKYIEYCLPLVPLGIFTFLADFLDRWFLQTYSGSREQGYFAISQQLAGVTLLITASILRVLWKEVAEALHHGKTEEARLLYTNTKKGLFFVSTLIAAGLGPWSKDILIMIFGTSYSWAGSVLMVLIFAAAYQTLGQIEGTLMMASEKTKTGLFFNTLLTPVSIGFSFLLIAGTSSFSENPIPPLGALGLAIKVLVVQIFSVTALGYFLCKNLHWRFEWKYQFSSIFVLSIIGIFAKMIFSNLFDFPLLSMLFAGFFYLASIAMVLRTFPKLLDVGFDVRRFSIIN
jgi:O-antigen/teichoic acid export membrane protein